MASKLGLKEALIRRLETGNTPVSMPAAAAYRQLARAGLLQPPQRLIKDFNGWRMGDVWLDK